MYSIYVTNKADRKVYIRLHRERLSSVNPSFHDDFTKSKDDPSYFLLRCGFCKISPYQTIPFTVDVARDEARMYASLYIARTYALLHSKSMPCPQMWIMDFELNCLRYGCLLIDSNKRRFKQANPEPVWIPVEKGKELPAKGIKAGSEVYLGRSSGEESTPCKIIFNGICKQICCIMDTDDYALDSGELLQNTGHEFVRAKTGDPMPPHAVIAGVSVPEGSLYLGRVGGNTPCSITTENGRIKSFCYGSNKVPNGEILLLTNDPKIYRQ